MINLYELLTRKLYDHESQIQEDYFSILTHKLELDFRRKWNTDGYTINGKVRFLLEFKRHSKTSNWDISVKEILCKCLIQALVYMCSLERKEAFIPEYTFIATAEYYCFLESSKISKYRNVVAHETEASTAWTRHPDLIKVLVENVVIPVHPVTKTIEKDILNLFYVPTSQKPIEINASVMETVSRLFINFTLKDIILDQLSTHEYVNIFLGILAGLCKPVEGEAILSTSLSNAPQVNINRKEYDGFINTINIIKDPEIINEIVSNKSELIDQIIRRYEGEFFTPQKLVLLGNKYIENFFGKRWREDNIIHEPTSGLFQLTREGGIFKNLFCSTLNQADIDFSEKLHYNDEATKWQYDWLNDDVEKSDLIKEESKLPNNYIDLISSLPLIMLSNFPYGAAGDHKLEGSGKDSIANITKIHKLMQESDISLDKAMENLYTQCLYRCLLHKQALRKKDFYIACYCPILFLTGPGFKEFRKLFFSFFKLEKGFIIPSKVFPSLKSKWPIIFGIFSSGKSEQHFSFELDLYDENLNYVKKTSVYNVANNLRSWIKPKSIYLTQKKNVPIMSSYINVGKRDRKQYIDIPDRWPADAFSLLVFDSNNIEKSISSVYIINCGIRSGLGRIKINSKNMYRCLASFTARKTSVVIYDTDTAKQEFSKPNTSHPDLEQFLYDSLVYSSFNNSSHQTSLENITSCGKTWNIKNELFWFSKEKIVLLSRKFGNYMLYNHATRSSERFLYKELSKVYSKLSEDAKLVLDIVNELIDLSFYKRDELNILRSELNINRFDAGWKQCSELFKFCDLDIKPFNEAYRNLEIRLLDETIKLGFLK